MQLLSGLRALTDSTRNMFGPRNDLSLVRWVRRPYKVFA